ncbi:hypothetical protein OEA41_010384 [Lepraria neglecta]|uniref:Uncharacterized protein n=1 Tax=Lepraria neglecta TaxID=209136 RepID=A0AAD9Z0P5_9LECA|nr:hypothetical protein OEA41_010384 [Lepraria neglecta]
MFYWPTPAPLPNITTFVGPDGFTYNSPSVYLVYKGISATGDCGSGGLSGTIGSSHASLTLSYAQSEIKSCGTAPYQLDVQTVNFASISPNCIPPSSPSSIASAGIAIPAPSASQPLPLETAPPSTPLAVIGPGKDPPDSKTVVDPGSTGDPTADLPHLQDPTSHPTEPSTTESSFAITIAGGQILPATVINPSSVVVAGLSIEAGASAVQIEVQKVSMDPTASKIMVNGQAHALPLPVSPSTSPVNNNALATALFATSAAGNTMQGLPSPGVVLVDEESVTRRGDLILISSTPVALDANGGLMLGSSTIQDLLPPPSISAPVTAGGNPVTILPNDVAIDSTILTPGALPITVSGTPISLNPSNLVMGTSSIPVSLPLPH